MRGSLLRGWKEEVAACRPEQTRSPEKPGPRLRGVAIEEIKCTPGVHAEKRRHCLHCTGSVSAMAEVVTFFGGRPLLYLMGISKSNPPQPPPLL